MIHRAIEHTVVSLLKESSAVAILGPRQVGKTTLAKSIAQSMSPTPLYLDLEKPSDLAKLSDIELYLKSTVGCLTIFDEVQRMPNLFQILRSVIDERRVMGLRHSQFLLLGSSSKELLKHSSESLAGRVIYTELHGFNIQEVAHISNDAIDLLWLRGGFPDSFFANSEISSNIWRQSFIMTYLEREVPLFGHTKISSELLRRLFTMIAHAQGDLLNISKLANALGISVPTVTRYIDLFEDLFLVRLLRPWSSNAKKRMIKAPKIYIRDSGITHSLLNITTFDDLFAHYVVGGSFEGFVIENILSVIGNKMIPWFYRTSTGSEIDLLLESGGNKLIAIEIKRSLVPVLSKGFYVAIDDLKPKKCYVVYPGVDSYFIHPCVEVLSLSDLLKRIVTEEI